MKISRLDLDGAGSPSALVTRILETLPALSIPVPLEALCAAFDIVSITEIETNGFEAALITNRQKAQGAILVAKDKSRQRRRFSIAHELGHFLIPAHLPSSSGSFECMARDMRIAWSKEQPRAMRMEAEANRFAAQLLMPPPLLRSEIRKTLRPDLADVVGLATKFDVSREAMSRAYVDQHREGVAIIIARQGKIVRSYRSPSKFPWLDVQPGQKMPAHPLLQSSSQAVDEISAIEECDPAIWFDSSSANKVDRLTKQFLVQRNDFALILLHAELRDEEEEDDCYHRDDKWRLRF